MNLIRTLILLVAFLGVPRGVLWADAETHGPNSGVIPLQECSIWVYCKDDDELCPVSQPHSNQSSRIELEAAQDADEEERDVLEGRADRRVHEFEAYDIHYLPPLQWRYDAGFETRTYRIFGPEANVSPALIMVNEKRLNEYFLFMFFSLSVKW